MNILEKAFDSLVHHVTNLGASMSDDALGFRTRECGSPCQAAAPVDKLTLNQVMALF